MQSDIGLPDPKRPRHILPSTQQGLPIQRMNMQVNDRKSAAPRVTPDARITRGELELVKALLRARHLIGRCCTLSYATPGRKRGVRYPAVHDALEQQPAQISLGGVRGLAASLGALDLPGDEPVRQSHRRRLRSRGFPVAARPARARAALPRPGRLPVGPGRGAARGRLLRGHERRGRPTRTHRRRGARASRWCRTRSSRPPQPDRPYVVTLQLDFNNTGAVDVAKQLRQKVGIDGDQPGEIENGKVKLYVIGQGALGAAATLATKHDIAQAEQWNLPIVLIVLLAVFGSLAAAAMPLVLGICTVVVTMGLVYLLSMYTTMSVFVTSTVSMFGIALAIDYSLFILMRFREELRRGPRPAAGRGRGDGHLRSGGGAVRPDRDRVGHRHLPDQHPGAEVDGHRRDPRGRRRGADVDDPDARRCSRRSAGRRPSGRRTCTGRGARRPPSRGSGPAGPVG